MGWIQCSVVSTRQKFVLKFYEMNMILRSLKEMEESKVSMNNFLLFIINGRRMERNFKLKGGTFRKSSWKIKNCVTREDRFHLLRSKIKFPFDDTSINFYFFFFQSTLLPRSSLLSRNLSPSVRHSDFLVHFLCMREKENEKRDARFPDTQLNDDNQLPRCNVAIIGRHYAFSLNSRPGTPPIISHDNHPASLILLTDFLPVP